MFERKISSYIDKKRMFAHDTPILVALSGGADSVALLRVLLSLGYKCHAAHCNFHLRGEDSDRDEAFVRRLCEKLQTPLSVQHFDTIAHARHHGISIEMAARELRYNWFDTLLKETNCKSIAVGHHRNDSIETFFLNLIRGAGIQGLQGIQSVRNTICRPLLEVDKEEILSYLSHLGQEYVTDATNHEQTYLRNKIRLSLLPLLKECNPGIEETILQTMQRLQETDKVYRAHMEILLPTIIMEEGRYSIQAILTTPSPKSVLFELFHPKGFNSSQIEEIYTSLFKQSGKHFYSSTYILLKDRDSLLLQPVEKTAVSYTLCQEIIDVKEAPFRVPTDNTDCAYLDADKMKLPLQLRKWKSGDCFIPYGMTSRKKVRDYLRDKKRSRFDKEKQCVVVCGEEIVWLVGLRTDERFKVTDRTQRVLKLWVKT